MSSKQETTDMIVDTKPGSVPRLRFPEFREAGDWTTETLDSLVTISTQKVGSGTCIPMSITSGVGLVSQQEKFGRVIAGSSYKNYLLLKKNDFAYNKSATKEYPEGFIALYKGSELAAVPNSIFTCFRTKELSVSPQYLNYLFLGNLHGQWLRKFIEVGARAHGSLSVSDKDLLALPVPLPKGKRSLAEQQKIADCLSSLDELIAAQACKIDALKTHKKGLMQQLFPIEGETQPRLRFIKFQNAGDWYFTTVGGLIEAGCLFPPKDGNHGNIHPKSSDYVTNGIPFIMASDLNEGLIDIENCHFISKEQAEKLKKGFAKEGDVLLSHKGTVGEVAVVRHINTPYLMLTPQVTYYRIKEPKNLSNEFLAQRFISDAFQLNLADVSGGGTRAYIGITAQTQLPLQLPKDIEEQQKIANCLTSLDELITAQTQKIEMLKSHKKGLMRQLFPTTEVVEA